MSSTSAITQVPMFNGSNYPTWESRNASALAAQISGIQCPNDNTSNWNSQKRPRGTKGSQGAPSGQQTSPENPSSNGKNPKRTCRGGKGGKRNKNNQQNVHESTTNNTPTPITNFATAHISTIPSTSPLINPPVGWTPLKGVSKTIPEFVQGSSKEPYDPILANMKKEEEEIDLLAEEIAIHLDKFYDSYLVNEHGNDLGDAYMNDMDKEEYGSGNEKLIFWQVAFSKFKRNLTNQMHRTKQMFSKLCTQWSKKLAFTHLDYSKYAIVSDMDSVNMPKYVFASLLDVDNTIYLQNMHCVNKNANNSLDQELTPWLLDSGASGHFTPHIEDFADYKKFPDPIPVQTADKNSKVFILRAGTVILTHDNGLGTTQMTKLYPVYYQPHCTH
ncbi:hypothetical protein GYMLUDRAFT_243757 [Collybiopsis luxurians FD-317 M1]|uniref:Retrovirus-related Pol polyprotein from transposon TNT 1-94-like beta-barrel domain-containing protein n=1 Tax=Collybiopsis luxurians FD-317 M1 TaxID=944289 RepID=A0A0D0CQ28_9AGAR|nr:hypothetical protein GYMLUDRAFT_243757 [Collybiopsis luxurians FD-317 M1]